MKVSRLMSTKPVSVNMDDSLTKVKALFDELSFHHILVVEARQLQGVISDRDLLKNLSPRIDTVAATTQDLAGLNKRAHQIMSRKPISIQADASVGEAIALFNQHIISCIPVVDTEEHLVGILSWRDIMRALTNKIA